MKKFIETSVQESKRFKTFHGCIAVYDDGRFLYSELSKINRTNYSDAKFDAEKMRHELLIENMEGK